MGATVPLGVPWLDPTGVRPDMSAATKAIADWLATYLSGTWTPMSSWLGLTWVGGSGSTAPQAIIRAGRVSFKGIIQRADGNPLATSSTLAIINAGFIPVAFRPQFLSRRPASTQSPVADVRVDIDTDGSMSIVTPATAPTYFDLSNLGYPSVLT